MARSIQKIGNKCLETREQCIEILTNQLENYAQSDPFLTGFLINYLVNLKATSSLDTIREAYKHDCVDCGVLGDVEDVEIELGVQASRSNPPPRYEWVRTYAKNWGCF